MRIQGPSGSAVAVQTATARRPAAAGFNVADAQTARAPAAAGHLRALGTIDALVALQAYDDPAERRRRSVAHGRRALDMLDSLKLGLLDGSLEPADLHRLKSLSGGFREPSGDPGLDSVMGEIELRVEVELAKAGIR